MLKTREMFYMKNSLVSVIIPVDNKGLFLKSSVDSVLKQTFQDFEVIIVDNSRDDSVKQIVDTYEDNRISYFRQKNVNLNAARNLGIKKSKGQYIALLDADNLWLPEKLEKQLDILDKKPDVSLVYCGTAFIDENNSVIGEHATTYFKGHVFKKLVMNNFLHNGSVPLFRKECLQKTGMFDENIDKMTEWEFYLRFSINYKFWGLEEKLTLYRIFEKAKSNDFEFFETSGFKILNKIFQRTDIEIGHLKHINSAYAMRYRYIGKKYFENERFDKSKGYFYEAIKRDFLACCRSDVLGYYLLCCLPGKNCKSVKKRFPES